MSQPVINKPREDFRHFYESVGDLYPEEDIVYSTLRGMIRRQFVLSYLKTFQGMFLDLGCNRGSYISHYKNGRAVGVDIAFSVLRAARQRLPEAYLVQGDAQYLSFLRSDSINVILCSEVIEHVQNPQQVFLECFRVLKPSGHLLVTTPNYKNNKPTWIKVDEMLNYGVRGVVDNQYFHTAFRPEELKYMTETAGFRVLECGTFEKEVKYATRIPVFIYYMLNLFNRITFKNQSFDQFNKKMLDRGSRLIYTVCTALGLNNLLTGLVKEGVRSYILVQKL